MMRIGAHMSVAGGVANAVERARVHGCEALQIFAKNASQWRGRPLDPSDVRLFRRRIEETGIAPVVSHASYLINLATTNPALRQQSIEALADEIDRAHTLGLLGVVIHPGTCTAISPGGPGAAEGRGAPGGPGLPPSASADHPPPPRQRWATEALREGGHGFGEAGHTRPERDALSLAAAAVGEAFRVRPRWKTMVILEHTAGQGRTIGYRFEHLAAILEHLDGSPRVGVCLDTCHLIASGYDIVSADGYARTFAEFDRLVGFDRLRVVHANDSKRPCGSRVDRHEHIGRGCLGLEPFRRILHDSRFAGRPLLIETEKSAPTTRPNAVGVDPLDAANLDTLRRLRQ
jgi:deoxyribonuclease-4